MDVNAQTYERTEKRPVGQIDERTAGNHFMRLSQKNNPKTEMLQDKRMDGHLDLFHKYFTITILLLRMLLMQRRRNDFKKDFK